MRVLVTGGAGFIGSHLVDALLERGHRVSVLDNLTTGLRSQVPNEASFHELDLRDAEGVAGALKAEAPEVIFHLAAQADVRRSMDEPSYDASVNIVGSLHLLEYAARAGLHRFIFASTGGAIYGEPDALPVPEDHPDRPLSNYGVSKAAVERFLRVHHQAFDLQAVALRYANAYGPRQNPKGEAGVVAIFSKLMLAGKRPTIFGDGTKTRDYVHVSDIVAANLAALEREAGGVYNIGTGVSTSDQAVFEAVRDALAVNLEPIYGPRRKGEVEHICLNAVRAQQELSWKPEVEFRSGVQQTADWYREQAG
jgi:UDP-glucose 4-epimerase